jgi:hypothetical protein
MRLAFNIARVLSQRLHNTSLSLARAKGMAGLRAMYRHP